jgi:heme-degrading monooxygenase HmoA
MDVSYRGLVDEPEPSAPPAPVHATAVQATQPSAIGGRVGVAVLIDVERRHRLWGMSRIVRGRAGLRSPAGLEFSKVLGSGHQGGFGLRPSATHHGLFLVFTDDACAEDFVSGSPVMAAYAARARELATVKLRPISSRGRWGGVEPFGTASSGPGEVAAGAIDTLSAPVTYARGAKHSPWGTTVHSTRPVPTSGPIAALTRASIRPAAAASFWRRAPPAQADLDRAHGCLLAAGLGEAPIFRQATFSIWESAAAMDAYARSGAHLAAIRAAREGRFFSEDLFARFVPYDARGSWRGRALAPPA